MTAEDLPADLSEPFVKALEWLMLAQAQECVWQRAVLGELPSDLSEARQITWWLLCVGLALAISVQCCRSLRALQMTQEDDLLFLMTKFSGLAA